MATGLRANEPLRLDRDDVDLVNGVLTIRDTKFGKSRYVPLHPTTQRALQRYAARRNRYRLDPDTPSFFVSDRGTRLTEWCVRWTFVKLSHEIGCVTPATPEDLACTIYVIDWPSTRSSGGINAAPMSSGACRSCRPISGTPISPTRTGI